MKKCFAWILALMLLFSASALAETMKVQENIDSFDIEFTVPEGGKVEQGTLDEEQLYVLSIEFPEDKTSPYYLVLIGHSEEYDGLSMSDLTDEDVKAIADVKMVDMEAPTYEIKTLEDGVKYLQINDKSENYGNSVMLVTIYKGYMIELSAFHDDMTTDLTDAEVAMCVTIIDNINVLPVAE